MTTVTTRQVAPPLSLDMLAVSLMLCLLAAVIALLASRPAAEPPIETPEAVQPAMPELPELPDWGDLQARAAALGVSSTAASQANNALDARLTRAAAQRDAAVLEALARELSDKMALLAAARGEAEKVSSLKQALAALSKKDGPTHNSADPRRLQGRYGGRYVLIECVADAVVVYPGAQRLPAAMDAAQFDALIQRIDAAGFVAFAVRPSGWFKDSLDTVRPRVLKALAERQAGTQRRIGRTTLPLTADESIDDLLPRDGGAS